jgi:hypothetical protein
MIVMPDPPPIPFYFLRNPPFFKGAKSLAGAAKELAHGHGAGGGCGVRQNCVSFDNASKLLQLLLVEKTRRGKNHE